MELFKMGGRMEMGLAEKKIKNAENCAIRLWNITQEFGTKKVLNQVSLGVEQGEIFGLLGPSGAGKTTMIKILTGQLKQTDGTASLLGKDVAEAVACTGAAGRAGGPVFG